jgi:hypothetical protein
LNYGHSEPVRLLWIAGWLRNRPFVEKCTATDPDNPDYRAVDWEAVAAFADAIENGTAPRDALGAKALREALGMVAARKLEPGKPTPGGRV